jgi:phage terminase small subunit
VNTLANRYERFAREYVIDLNAPRAAIAAGYSEKRAHVTGYQLVANRRVAKIIERLQTQRASKLEIKADRVAEELARLGFSNMMDYMRIDEEGKPTGLDLRNLTRDQAACIQEITEDTTGGSGDGERRLILRTKFKLADKAKNLELLGRHLGMFQDKLQITGIEGLAERLAEARRKRANG